LGRFTGDSGERRYGKSAAQLWRHGESQDGSGLTVVHMAAFKGNIPVPTPSTATGPYQTTAASLDDLDKEGNAPIHLASPGQAADGQFLVTKRPIDRGRQGRKYPAHLAIPAGDVELVRLMVSQADGPQRGR
jgi:hypothetical protein